MLSNLLLPLKALAATVSDDHIRQDVRLALALSRKLDALAWFSVRLLLTGHVLPNVPFSSPLRVIGAATQRVRPRV
jgi:hypothetical protein